MRPANQAFDPAQRAAEKNLSRSVDARALVVGTVSQEQLQRENSMFSGAATVVLGKPKRAY
jgi:hypothetical protein